MKILLLNDLLQGGGVERLLQDLVDHFHDKYELTVLTGMRDSEYQKILPANVKYLYIREAEDPVIGNLIKRKLYWKKRAWKDQKMRKKIAKEGYDLLLCLKEGWTILTAMKFCNDIPRKIAWNHTDYLHGYYTDQIFQTAEKELSYIKKFEKMVCVSQSIEESIRVKLGDPGNLIVKYNPLNFGKIRKMMEEPVTDVKRSNRPLLVTVGRLNVQKGYDVLLEVCALLNEEGYIFDLWIIGGGEAWNHYEIQRNLEDLIKKYQLDNVYLLGPKSNPYKYMKMADWFLSSSRYEGYSYVSQEASIVGLPLLLTDCSGVTELLKEDQNGIMVENSFRGLYKGMKNILEHEELKDQYKREAIRHEATYYEQERYDAIEELILLRH